ncbi:hypothetical protein QFC21_000262 [Naganishia friedmannii]|uniref:Uncharacterized protein n=1 Tax=Naganishia friedmannii TaxID=89922 RepID=A0ACC2WAZ5_9TREE|nr:hypothetical protein QFC21_000262 [Naganishia friedmannii]
MAAPQQQQQQQQNRPPVADNYASDDDEIETNSLQDDDDIQRWMVTEAALNRWSRYPAEAQRANLDGPKNNPKVLPLGNTKVPVIDEVTTWIKRNNSLPPDKGPYKPKGRRSTLEDADANYESAAAALGLDVPTLTEKADRQFYDRWANTLDYRWNYDFADLRLRRAKKGWKWRLVRIRPNGEVIVQPFIKPSQKPYRERGILSSKYEQPRVTSQELLKQLTNKAQWRWRGMPVTRGEEQEDEKRLSHLIAVEGLKDHYGFIGEIISQSTAEMGSSVYILAYMFLTIYIVIFAFGPPAATPYLSEFLVALLPLQSSLKGVVAMAGDMKRKAGNPYTEGVKIIWQERGQRMADEAILRDIPRPSGAYAPAGSGPKGGSQSNMVNFSALQYATKLELDARQYLGWHQEYYKGGFYTSAGQTSSARAVSNGLREEIVKLSQFINELTDKPPTYHVQDEQGFEACIRSIEKRLSKEHIHARTNQGTQSFQWMLQDKYGATEEEANKFLNVLFWEQGVDAAARSGMRRAIHYDGGGELRDIWNSGLLGDKKPFWDPKYVHEQQPNMPAADLAKAQQIHEEVLRTGQDPASEEFKKDWGDKLEATGRNRNVPQNNPWQVRYVPNYQELEDMFGLVQSEKFIPGSGFEQRSSHFGRTSDAFLYNNSQDM